MTMGNERMGLQPLALTAEQRLTDRIDLLRSEVDRLRTLNNARGARLARIRILLARWRMNPELQAVCEQLARQGDFP